MGTTARSSLTLRLYEPTDWTAISSIHDASRLDELRASVGVEAFLSLAQTAESEGLFDGEVWVAERNGRVVGFVAFTRDELTWLYTDPAHYRRGVGRTLLLHALTRCEADVSTEVLVGNEPALALYLSVGFRVLKKVDGKLTGNEQFAASGYVLQYSRVPANAPTA